MLNGQSDLLLDLYIWIKNMHEPWMKKRHDYDVKKEWIVTSPGVVPALETLVIACSEPDVR